MKQLVTKAIVLGRTDYGEADRIVTLLTPDHGKMRLMARGVRRVKSKLAGGVELFSISDITYIQGKGDLGTLISARLDRHYGRIVKDIERVQLGYEIIKLLNKATEDHTEPEYFYLLEIAFQALDDDAVSTELIRLWFQAQLLKLAGHQPNLHAEADGQQLAVDRTYNFDFENMAFIGHPGGHFTADAVKALRLLFSENSPVQLRRVTGLAAHLPGLEPLMRAMLASHT